MKKILLLLMLFGIAFAQTANFSPDNLYATNSVRYFAFAHIDSAGTDSAYITTPGAWYQMQGTIHHVLIGFTKTATGLRYDGSDSLRFDHTIALNARSTVAGAVISIGLSIAGGSPHVEMDIYAKTAGKYYPISLKDLGFICPGEKMRVVITADKVCGVYVGSGGVTSKPAGF